MPQDAEAMPLVDGIAIPGHVREVRSPIDGDGARHWSPRATKRSWRSAMAAAAAGFAAWDATPVEARAAALMRAGDAAGEEPRAA